MVLLSSSRHQKGFTPVNKKWLTNFKGVRTYLPAQPGLYAGFFGRGGSIAQNPISQQLYAPPEAVAKFWELLTQELSWVEKYRQSNTTSEA